MLVPTYPHAAYTSSQKKIFQPRVRKHPIVILHGKTRETTQGLFQRPGLAQQVLSPLGREISDSPTAHKAGRSQP